MCELHKEQVRLKTNVQRGESEEHIEIKERVFFLLKKPVQNTHTSTHTENVCVFVCGYR